MGSSHEQFHSPAGRRRILIADDEEINREILKSHLEAEYELLFACDGVETMEMIRANADTLSLVLLDILMPGMSGLEVLKAVRENDQLPPIPIIVTTSEDNTEVESLNLGAYDFFKKPYPTHGVIMARVQRLIELYEDWQLIQSTERDVLTNLYNKDYFYSYAQQFDQYHKDLEMDAMVVDINHFHMINERYGKAAGDAVLCQMAEQLRILVQDDSGIVCRKEADTFMVYRIHAEDYRQVMEQLAVQLPGDDASSGNRVHARIGVYSNVDKTIDIERRFDRAKMASDSVKGSFSNNIGIYDNRLHEQQLYAEQLIEEFPEAIAGRQFQVYYQPKFDVRPDVPILSSAEALVRWIHPEQGMISPGVFIPLFEENGLIQQLDMYVWQETARQIREWKDRLGYSIPVSVNVSRVDMYDPALPDTMISILEEHGLTGRDFLLEVTESAYTQDSRQIVETVEKLRSMGFEIEMDDFGTGYSSLNMISNLPIDALKLDMQFIRGAFQEGGNTHMLEVIIGISDYLSVPVIAEGVETEEQLHALKALGCDLVQGYFFSKPVPSQEFEAFILQRKEADLAAAERKEEEQSKAKGGSGSSDYWHLHQQKRGMLRPGEESDPADPEAEGVHTDEEAELPREHTGIQLRTASVFFVVLAMVSAAFLLVADLLVTSSYQRMQLASDRYISAQLAASDMEAGSDYLSDRVRCFVVTGEVEYLKDFYEEVEVTKRRDNAVANLEALLDGRDSNALMNLSAALEASNELIGIENHAIRLTVEDGDYAAADIPDAIKSVQLEPEELALTAEERRIKAQTLVFDNNYMHYKDKIRENVGLCTQSLIHASSQELEQASAQLALLVHIQTAMTIVFLLIVLAIVVIITQMIRKPLTNMVQKMQEQEIIPPTGVEELRFVTRTYNKILLENQEARQKLSHEASHDALTGLFNRGAYDLLMESADTEHMALILVDVDYFKGVNDTYGHAMGDKVLRRVADVLRHHFRSVDIICRIGGDEFAVIMTRVNGSMGQLVLNKVNRMNDLLQHPKDDLPPISLSVGVAFSDRKDPRGDIFKDADSALYQVKEAGRKGCRIYGS